MKPRPKEIIPGQASEPSVYKFNEQTQWPPQVDAHIQKALKDFTGKPLAYSQHANDRAGSKMGMSIGQIPGLGGKFPDVAQGWRPVEVEHDGQKITKMVMRGPLNDTHDVVMPITHSPAGPFATTAWPNAKDDTHGTLDLNRVHLPEEFKMGKPPRRPLKTDAEVQQPGYQPIPAHSGISRARIAQRWGYPSSKPTATPAPQLAYAYYIPECVNFTKLASLLRAFK